MRQGFKEQMQCVLRIYGYLKGLKFRYWCGMIGLSLMQSFFQITAAVAMTYVFRIGSDGWAALLSALLFFFAASLLGCILWGISGYMLYTSVFQATLAIKRDIFDHVQRFPVWEIEKHHSGDILSRMDNDVGKCEAIICTNIQVFLMVFFSVISAAVYSLYVHWSFIFVVIGVTALSMLIAGRFTDKVRALSVAVQESLSAFTQKMSDAISSAQVTRLFRLDKQVEKQTEEQTSELAGRQLRRNRVDSWLLTLTQVIGDTLFFFLVFMAVYLYKLALIPFSLIGGISQAVSNLPWLGRWAGMSISQLQSNLAAAGRVWEFLDNPMEEYDAPPVTPDQSAPAISMCGVNFAYEQVTENHWGIEDVDMHVGAKQTVALVGGSGGGKTTLFKLLMRYYEPSGGEILIFGIPIRNYPLKILRGLMAYVPQETYLFDGTVEDNIRFGKLDATDEEVHAASRAAQADEFINSLPQGYKTRVGERGTKLSGGQRQRIAIARALIKNAPLLLLDEATSSLDSQSEELVQKALDTLMEGRTTLVAAHRLSTVRNADCIHVMEDGRRVESGTHDALLEAQGMYAKLYLTHIARDKTQ